VVAVLSATYF